MKKIILFGDSIFNGYRQGHDTELITQALKQHLKNVQIKNISQSGATTVEALDRLKLIDPQADLVLVEYGTNDASTGWGLSAETYRKNLTDIVNQIKPRQMMIVGPSYPNPENPEIMRFYAHHRAEHFNQIARQVAREQQLDFVDLITPAKKLTNISSYYQADGQHLTDKGNTFLIKQLLPVIQRNL